MSYGRDAPRVESEKRDRRASQRPQRSSKAPAKPHSATPGKRLSDAKREERESRQRSLQLRRLAFGAGVMVLLAAVVFGAVALYRAPVFSIKEVAVSGEKHYSDADVKKIAAVPNDATLLRVPVEAIRERLEADPWIAEAKVDRDFPSTLNLIVRERTAAAVVDVAEDQAWLVSGDGYWLERVRKGESDHVVITDLKQVAPKRGSRVSEAEVQNAIKILSGLSSKLRKAVVTVSAPSVDETALRTRRDVEIFVGEAVSMSTKDRIVREILEREDGVVYINVRVIDRPTWRGLEAD